MIGVSTKGMVIIMATATVTVDDMRTRLIEVFGPICDDAEFRELCRKVYAAPDDEVRAAYMQFC